MTLVPYDPVRVKFVSDGREIPPELPLYYDPVEEQRRNRAAFESRWPSSRPLDLYDLQNLLASVHVRSLPLVKSYRALVGPTLMPSAVFIAQEMTMGVIDRDNSSRTFDLHFSANEPYPADILTRQFVLERVVRQFLIRGITHELDECVLVAGARVFDPHRGEHA